MDAGLIAYTRQRSLFQRLESVSNNVANADTNGFKSELAVYMPNATKIDGKQAPFPAMDLATDLSQGRLKETNRQLDVAIQGEGFFQIETPLGARYTRDGSFIVNSEGALTDKNGNPVVGDGGPISIEAEDYELKIGENGEIVSVKPEGTVSRGTIGVFKFLDNSKLQKVGDSYFKSDENPETATVKDDFVMAQGMLEVSNVDSVKQMAEMIDISRGVQSVAKIVQDENSRIKSAVQKIAGVK
jgi:flagellar basal-body rod protein FlgF